MSTIKCARRPRPRERLNFVKAGLKRVSADMEMPASLLMESINLYVINQHYERKFVVISTNISTASLDPDATSSTKSRRLLKSQRLRRSRKCFRNFPNWFLKWGFAKVYYNFCEQNERPHFPKPNNWFYRPNMLITIFG